MIRWVVGIVYRDGHVLIGQLRKRNSLIPKIVWTFPFKEVKEDESPRKIIKNLFQDELSMNVKVGNFLIKYVPSENPNIEQLFYEIKYISGNPIASRNYAHLTWVKPTQVLQYFSTSLSKDLMDYLRFLEKSGKGVIID